MGKVNNLALIAGVNEDIKLVVALARNINILALNAILLSRKAGEVAIGFGVISSELRAFSKNLTETMEALMVVSYTSIESISSHQRHLKMHELMTQASKSSGRKFFVPVDRDMDRQLNLHNTTLEIYKKLKDLVQDADDTSRFGCVISRSLKIEATYGGEYRNMLTQIAVDFSLLIDAIPDVINRLNNRVLGHK